MPGIATRFEILRLVIDELKKPTAGAILNLIAQVMESHSAHAHLGVIGPALADFLPSASPLPGQPLPQDYSGVWKTLFIFLGGDIGLYATLKKLRNVLAKMDKIAHDEDDDALIDLKESGEHLEIKETANNFKDLVAGLQNVADDLTDMIANGLRPGVCTPSPGAPVPPPSEWKIRDILHWKKSGKFAQTLLEKAHASNKPEFLAYAYGWLVGYAASVCGNSFINSSVGGPARTQWWRQRFVKNFVDAWVFGFYRTGATMSGDDPTPPYEQWPDLCDANLQKKIELGPLDPVDLMLRIKRRQQFPAGLLADDFGNYWVEAFTAVYGPPPPGQGVDPPGLNGAYLMTWLVLWFMTSGDVLECNLVQPVEPPNGCGEAPQELDPFKKDPQTGNPIEPPLPDVERDVEVNEGGVICGWIMAIIGGIAIATGSTSAGGALIAGGIAKVNDKIDVNWTDLRCQLYWLRMYIYLGLKGLHQLLTISAFGYPHANELKDDEQSLNQIGVPFTWATGKFLIRSRPSDNNFPSKPWDGSKLSFNLPPSIFETPRTIAYRTAAYPNYFINDNVNNPLSKGDVRTKGPSFPFRLETSAGGTQPPIQFGNVVANVIDLFQHFGTALPDWNLDGDRGLAYVTWRFDHQLYDPDNVQIAPEP